MAEYGATNRDYLWLDNVPVAVVDAGGGTATVSYVTADQLGTPRAISDVSGTTEWSWAYAGNAWGEQTPTSNGYTLNLRFPGQYADAESGLNYNVNRDYDPVVGRYVESDPLGLQAGPNTYAYVNGNSLIYTDPFGLWSLSFSAYDGIGGGISLTGEGLSLTAIGFRAGFGIGAGFSFNPKGSAPDESVVCEANSIGVFGDADVGLGPLSAGLGVNAGLTEQVNSGQFNGYGGMDPAISGGQGHGGLPIHIGSSGPEIEAQASTGIELTHYFGR